MSQIYILTYLRERRPLRTGDRVTCFITGHLYHGTVLELVGDPYQDEIPEIVIDCGLTTPRTFPENSVIEVNGERTIKVQSGSYSLSLAEVR